MGNLLSCDDLERQRQCILRAPLVVRDREYLSAADVIVDDSGTPDATLPILAHVSSLIEALRLGCRYELVYQLLLQLSLTASGVKVDVTWSRDEMLVCNFRVPCVYVYVFIVLLVLCFTRYCIEWDLLPHPLSCIWTMQHTL